MKSAIHWTKCHLLRGLERLLPVPVLTAILWPFAAIPAVRAVIFHPSVFCSFAHLPEALRPQRKNLADLWRLWRARTNLRLSLRMCYWPDRLAKKGWQRCCRWDGIDRVDEVVRAGHAVILAGFHIGPYRCLPHFLRARGMPAATMANIPVLRVFQQWVYGLSDAAFGLRGVPRRLPTSQLREVIEFLRPGRILFVAVDGVFGNRIAVTTDGVQFQMATGFLRLADRTSARIIPCLIETDGPLQFVIHFGTAIPQSLIHDPAQHEEAGRQVLQQLMPLIKRCSHQFCIGNLQNYHQHTMPEPLWQAEELTA